MSKDIEKLIVVGIDQALQGQAPGVMVTQVTGSPGDDIAVRIRGAGTLGNNNPLFVIDGVPTTGNINIASQVKTGTFFWELKTTCENINPYVVVMGSQGTTAADHPTARSRRPAPHGTTGTV